MMFDTLTKRTIESVVANSPNSCTAQGRALKFCVTPEERATDKRTRRLGNVGLDRMESHQP